VKRLGQFFDFDLLLFRFATVAEGSDFPISLPHRLNITPAAERLSG